MSTYTLTNQKSDKVKIEFTKKALTNMLDWSDRLGSDEITEIKMLIKTLN
jgi:hypothetical protein